LRFFLNWVSVWVVTSTRPLDEVGSDAPWSSDGLVTALLDLLELLELPSARAAVRSRLLSSCDIFRFFL
jgi:hypothetical protein